jgi:hypothetical protein
MQLQSKELKAQKLISQTLFDFPPITNRQNNLNITGNNSNNGYYGNSSISSSDNFSNSQFSDTAKVIALKRLGLGLALGYADQHIS